MRGGVHRGDVPLSAARGAADRAGRGLGIIIKNQLSAKALDCSRNSRQRNKRPVVDNNSLRGLAPDFNRGEALFE